MEDRIKAWHFLPEDRCLQYDDRNIAKKVG